MTVALWCDPSDSTDEVHISLPYPVYSFRNVGTIMYYANNKDYKNLYVAALSGTQDCYIGCLTENQPYILKGADISTIQFSLLYVTT